MGRRDQVLLAVGLSALVARPALGLLAGSPGTAWMSVPNGLSYLMLGAYATWRRPGHRAASRMLLWGVLQAVAMAAGAGYSLLTAARGTPSWAWLAVIALQCLDWVTAYAVLALFVVFPDGTYRGTLERAVVRSTALLLPLCVLGEVAGRSSIELSDLVLTDRVTASNPIAQQALAGVGAVSWVVLNVSMPAMMLLGAGLLLVRWRHAGAPDRRRIQWPLTALAATAVCVAAMGLVNTVLPPLPGPVQFAIYLPIVFLLPAGLLVGMLFHDLLDLGVVLRRSLAYTGLWLAITVAFVGIAALAGVVAGRRLPLAMAVATTVIATLAAASARGRLVRLADRLVFGRPVDPAELIGTLGRRFAEGGGDADVTGTLAEAVRHGLRAQWVESTIAGATATSTRAGMQDGPAELVVPVRVDGVLTGEIRCGPKESGRYDEGDRSLVETLGRQAGWAAQQARLSGELREKVVELEASRTRIVRAEEAGRRRLERDLHDGVQQDLVALLTHLGLARQQLHREGGSPRAEATLAEAHIAVRRTLEDLQDLVRGIHPTLLTDRGLVAAVEERSARMPFPVRVDSDETTRNRRFGRDVEAAAWFVVSECLTNAVKHAGSSAASVTFRADDGGLLVEVCDHGVGFDAERVTGSGLDGLRDRVEAMAGRLRLDSGPGGTVVRAVLPTGGHLG